MWNHPLVDEWPHRTESRVWSCCKFFGVWESLVIRVLREHESASSNLATPTNSGELAERSRQRHHKPWEQSRRRFESDALYHIFENCG